MASISTDHDFDFFCFWCFLGKASPRGGKGINLLVGVIVFMLYNNALLVAKSAIELGQIEPVIGLWGVHFLVLMLLVLLYQFRKEKIAKYIDRISTFNIKKESNV